MLVGTERCALECDQAQAPGSRSQKSLQTAGKSCGDEALLQTPALTSSTTPWARGWSAVESTPGTATGTNTLNASRRASVRAQPRRDHCRRAARPDTSRTAGLPAARSAERAEHGDGERRGGMLKGRGPPPSSTMRHAPPVSPLHCASLVARSRAALCPIRLQHAVGR
jgi:hypothetical protein